MSECDCRGCRPADVRFVVAPVGPGVTICLELVQHEDRGPFTDQLDKRWSRMRDGLWRADSGAQAYEPPAGNA